MPGTSCFQGNARVVCVNMPVFCTTQVVLRQSTVQLGTKTRRDFVPSFVIRVAVDKFTAILSPNANLAVDHLHRQGMNQGQCTWVKLVNLTGAAKER